MVQKNLSLNDRTATDIETLAKSEGVTQAEIVQKAVQQYKDDSWESRMERKISRIEERLGEGDTPSEDEPVEKEKTSQDVQETTTSDEKPVKERRADDMFEHLTTELADGDDIFPENWIETAIEDVWSDSEHMIEQYTPKIEKRLRANGWQYVKTRKVWCETDEAYEAQLKGALAYSRRVIDGDEDSREDVQEELVSVRQNKDAYVGAGLATEDEIDELLDRGSQRAAGLPVR